MVFRKIQIVHHSLDAIGYLTSTINLKFCHDGLFIIDALRLFAQKTTGQEILKRFNENIFVRQMREQHDDPFQVCLELIVRQLQTILSEDRVGVTSEYLSHSKLSNLKVDKSLEPLRSLNVEGTVAVEAEFDHVHELLEHFKKLLHQLALLQQFFKAVRFIILIS